MLTTKMIHKTGRIDQVVRDYFTEHQQAKEVAAKDLMDRFIAKGIFTKEYDRPGLPIRNVVRKLDAAGQLSLLKHCKVVRHAVNRNWYSER
jgi:hypothetical protein